VSKCCPIVVTRRVVLTVLPDRSAAEICLTLKNQGQEAYKPDIYGKSITVVRRIHADGGGSWKVKSASGKVISTKREELDFICDHCDIQVSISC
jgi:structural maintenance of chromosomes protein 6